MDIIRSCTFEQLFVHSQKERSRFMLFFCTLTFFVNLSRVCLTDKITKVGQGN